MLTSILVTSNALKRDSVVMIGVAVLFAAIAAVTPQTDVAFGNIIGSNIYNILGIGGMTALIAPSEVPVETVGFDNPVMIAASSPRVAFAWTGLRIARWEGALLAGGYVLYVWWLWP